MSFNLIFELSGVRVKTLGGHCCSATKKNETHTLDGSLEERLAGLARRHAVVVTRSHVPTD